jgi:hypothetical protein
VEACAVVEPVVLTVGDGHRIWCRDGLDDHRA